MLSRGLHGHGGRSGDRAHDTLSAAHGIPRLQPLIQHTRRVSGPGDSAVNAAVRSKKATETLSQFVARVLDQLSLSAWLPSAALVLLVYLVFALGSVLDADPPMCGTEKSPKECGPSAALGLAFRSMTEVTLGGVALLLVAIVVLTMLTQAFAFEAIRTMEGYWGAWGVTERIAARRSTRWASRRTDLDAQHRDLAERAWAQARSAISAQQAVRKGLGKSVVYTPDMLEFFEAAMFQRDSTAILTPAQEQKAMGIPWQEHADPDVLRRMVSVDKARRDFPKPRRALPTRFGNVLRHHEDEMGVKEDLEAYVQDNFDRLPLSLQVAHDEQRTRLDLYCTMVFVLTLVAAVAVSRYIRTYPGYAVAALALCAIGGWVSYWSAIASARAYGSVLGSIARHLKAVELAHPAPVEVP